MPPMCGIADASDLNGGRVTGVLSTGGDSQRYHRPLVPPLSTKQIQGQNRAILRVLSRFTNP